MALAPAKPAAKRIAKRASKPAAKREPKPKPKPATKRPARPSRRAGQARIRARYDRVFAPNYAPLPIVPQRGAGMRLWDADGNVYLDFAAGIAVSALGHAHPALREMLASQAGKLWHVSNLLVNQPAIDLAQRLCDLTFAERVFFANSGSEVNEAALKLARRYARERNPRATRKHHSPHGARAARKHKIIAFDNAFHGRTFFTVCVGGQRKYSDGFGPKPGGIAHVPFNDVAALRAAADDSLCAIIVEPIQGESGVRPASAELVRAARELCDRFDALLIFDEVQTGVGRCGALYRYQQLGVVPDILTTAKGLGGGFPIGAMLTTDAIAQSLAVGSHGSTFGGNPMACAVAAKVLEIVAKPAMLKSIQARGAALKRGLQGINRRTGIFSEIRGEGLLIGCEMAPPWRDRARDLLAICLRHGLLALVAGPNVLRLAPPLIITADEVVEGLQLLEAAVQEMAQSA